MIVCGYWVGIDIVLSKLRHFQRHLNGADIAIYLTNLVGVITAFVRRHVVISNTICRKRIG